MSKIQAIASTPAARLTDEREVRKWQSAGVPGAPRDGGPGPRPVPCQAEPSTTRRSAIAKTSLAGSVPNAGSSGHQTVTGRSWMRSGATMASRRRPGLSTAHQVDRLGAGRRRVLAGQDAMGQRTGVEPGGAVGIGGRHDEGPRRMTPGQVLDRGRATLTHLRPAGDDDEVHHARPGGDVVVDDLVADSRLGGGSAGPRSGQAPPRSRRCSWRGPASASPPARGQERLSYAAPSASLVVQNI